MTITFSTCYYPLQISKNPKTEYIKWIINFFSIVNYFNLVIYTNMEGIRHIPFTNNPRIKLIIKPLENFYFYKYKKNWIINHSKKTHVNKIICWELNMLWSEKLAFVKETIDNSYFDTDIYGWCDVGYFRNRINDTNLSELSQWCRDFNEKTFDKNRVYYSSIYKNHINIPKNYFQILLHQANYTLPNGLPRIEFGEKMLFVAGGFFMLHKDKMNWWFSKYDEVLQLYFENNYKVVHDQTILATCILQNLSEFRLYEETKYKFDFWFMAQRKLNYLPNKISILLPIDVSDRIEGINESVSSIMNQNYQNWELIIGFHGCPPNSHQYNIAKQHEIDERVTVLDLPVTGKSNVLNYMVNLCNGCYVSLLDVDTIWHPNKLVYQKMCFETYDVIGSQCFYFDNEQKSDMPCGDITHFDFTQNNPLVSSSVLIRRELCYWNDSPDCVGDYDQDLWCRLKTENKKFFNVPSVLLKCRLPK